MKQEEIKTHMGNSIRSMDHLFEYRDKDPVKDSYVIINNNGYYGLTTVIKLYYMSFITVCEYMKKEKLFEYKD